MMAFGKIGMRTRTDHATGSGHGSATASESSELARFETVVLPHLDAAYNLARWKQLAAA